MKKLSFILQAAVVLCFFLTTACSDVSTPGIQQSGDQNVENGGGNTNPNNPSNPSNPSIPDPSPIIFPKDPFSILGIYEITSHSINGAAKDTQKGSEFRVNVSLQKLNDNQVLVALRIKLNNETVPDFVKIISLTPDATADLNTFIAKTFKDLGAEVTGDYTMKFTLAGDKYPEVVNAGLINSSDTLVLNLKKIKNLAAGTGLDGKGDIDAGPIYIKKITVPSATIVKGPNDQPFELQYNIEPANATDKQVGFKVNNTPDVITISEEGLVTINKTGTVSVTIFSKHDPSISANVTIDIVSKATAVNFKSFEYGIPVNKSFKIEPIIEGGSSPVVRYKSADDRIASIDFDGNITGKSIGSTTIEVTVDDSLHAECIVHVFTPADLSNLSSMQGTYAIVDFNQYNGTLDVGTNLYGGVERMLGEVTIEAYGDNKAKVTSKIQMDSSTLFNYTGIGSAKAQEGLFSILKFEDMNFNSGVSLQSPSYKEQLGLFESGKKEAGRITKESNAENKFHINQIFKEAGGFVTVKVNTYIVKMSDTVKVLDDHRYFDFVDKEKIKDSQAKIKNFGQAALKEPYYTDGQVKTE